MHYVTLNELKLIKKERILIKKNEIIGVKWHIIWNN